jgi:hypothetical protein
MTCLTNEPLNQLAQIGKNMQLHNSKIKKM